VPGSKPLCRVDWSRPAWAS